MDSSKQTIIGVALIFVIFVGWLYYMNSQQAKLPKSQPQKPAAADTSHAVSVDTTARAATLAEHADTTLKSGAFASSSSAPETTETVETPLFTARISSHGAAISSFVLKEFKTYDGRPLDLVNHNDYHGADIDLKFVASDGRTVQTNDLPFTLDTKSLTLGENDSVTFSATYKLDSGRSIEKIFHFTGKGYLIGMEYRLNGLENSVSGYHYTAALDDALPFVEQRSKDELSNAKAFASIA